MPFFFINMIRTHEAPPMFDDADKKTALIAAVTAVTTSIAVNLIMKKFDVEKSNESDTTHDFNIKLPGGKKIKMTREELDEFRKANIKNGGSDDSGSPNVDSNIEQNTEE